MGLFGNYLFKSISVNFRVKQLESEKLVVSEKLEELTRQNNELEVLLGVRPRKFYILFSNFKNFFFSKNDWIDSKFAFRIDFNFRKFKKRINESKKIIIKIDRPCRILNFQFPIRFKFGSRN